MVPTKMRPSMVHLLYRTIARNASRAAAPGSMDRPGYDQSFVNRCSLNLPTTQSDSASRGICSEMLGSGSRSCCAMLTSLYGELNLTPSIPDRKVGRIAIKIFSQSEH